MSRLNSQSRLSQGPRDLELPRSFLASPQRIAPASTANLGAILQGAVQVSAQVVAQNKASKDKLEAEQKRAVLNDLLAQKRAASEDESLIGDYADSLDSAIASYEDSDPFKTELLKLTTGEDIQRTFQTRQRQKAVLREGAIRSMFTRFADSLDLDDPELIEAGHAQRQKIILDNFLEVASSEDPDLVSEVESNADMSNFLTNLVRNKSINGYQGEHDRRLEQLRNEEFQVIREGYDAQIRNGQTDLATASEELSVANGRRTTPYQETVSIVSTSANNIALGVASSSMPISDAIQDLDTLSEQVDALDNEDAQQILNATYNRVADEHAVATARILEMEYEDLISELPPKSPEEIRKRLNDLAVAQWEIAAGVDVPDNASIHSFDAGSGVRSAIAQKISGVVRVIDTRLDRMDAVRNTKNLSSYSTITDTLSGEKHLEAMDVEGARAAISLFVGEDPEIPDEQVWVAMGASQTQYELANFSTVPDKGSKWVSWLTEHGKGGFEMVAGGMLSTNQTEFDAYLGDIDTESRAGLTNVRDYLIQQGITDPTAVSAEQYGEILAQFDKGRQEAEKYAALEVGSHKVDESLAKDFAKALLSSKGLDNSLPISVDTMNRLIYESSRLGSDFEEDGWDRETAAKRASEWLTSEGMVLHFDHHSDTYQLRPRQQVVEGSGVDPRRLDADLNISDSFLSRQLIGMFNRMESLQNRGAALPGSADRNLSRVVYDKIGRAIRDRTNNNRGDVLNIQIQKNVEGVDVEGKTIVDTLIPLLQRKIPTANRTLFLSSEDDPAYLRLVVVTSNGRPRIMAKGRINGQAFIGEDMIDLAPFDPEWYMSVGESVIQPSLGQPLGGYTTQEYNTVPRLVPASDFASQ